LGNAAAIDNNDGQSRTWLFFSPFPFLRLAGKARQVTAELQLSKGWSHSKKLSISFLFNCQTTLLNLF
jgi:hypothetical protein